MISNINFTRLMTRPIYLDIFGEWLWLYFGTRQKVYPTTPAESGRRAALAPELCQPLSPWLKAPRRGACVTSQVTLEGGDRWELEPR